MNDDRLFFSDAQSVVKGSTGDVDGTNVLDFTAAAPSPGTGRAVWLNIVVTTGVAGGTITFVLKESADNSTFTAKYSTAAIAAAAAAPSVNNMSLNMICLLSETVELSEP